MAQYRIVETKWDNLYSLQKKVSILGFTFWKTICKEDHMDMCEWILKKEKRKILKKREGYKVIKTYTLE